MKKSRMLQKCMVVSLLSVFLLPVVSFAQGEKVYEVPVEIHQYYDTGKVSMANGAMKPIATVTEKDGKAMYELYFKPMTLMDLEGRLTNLFIYEDVETEKKVEAEKSEGKEGYETKFSFTRQTQKEDSIAVAVWVDAMDQIAGGTKGAGEQKAKLQFDYSKAKEIHVEKATPEKEKEEPKKMGDSNQIHIVINSEEKIPQQAPFIDKGTTFVPVRFISESLGLKVDYVAATKTVLVGEGQAQVSLVIGTTSIQRADGSTIQISAPSRVIEGTTFVPLRAIGELSGSTIKWEQDTKTVYITK